MTESNGPRQEGPWRVHETETSYENPWMKVETSQVTHPDGSPGIYGVVRFRGFAIGVLPLDEEGFTWLVGQHRFALGQYSWELPEGGGARDTDPAASARRELAEETGLRAAELHPLGEWYTSNSITDEKAIAFIATGLTMGEMAPEPSEELEIKRLSFAALLGLVISGEITDGFTVMMVTTAYIKAQRGELPEGLCRLILNSKA